MVLLLVTSHDLAISGAVIAGLIITGHIIVWIVTKILDSLDENPEKNKHH
jgi:hypothetical protein